MRVYRHWARACCDADGEPRDDGDVVGIGWSDQSAADAERHALQRARHIAELLRRDELPPDSGWYYPDRPIREPVIDELRIGDRLAAVMTRNVYGAGVLNAANAMFVDIDRPAKPRTGLIGRLFGKPAPAPADDTPGRVAQVVARHPGLGLRLYETAAGYRGLMTSRPFDPVAPQTLTLLEALGSDRLYVRLCKAQECFRARVTPKPWRCDLPCPPRGYPWTDQQKQRDFERWSQRYDRAIAGVSVCRFIEAIGERAVHPEVEPVLRLHDDLTCTGCDRLA